MNKEEKSYIEGLSRIRQARRILCRNGWYVFVACFGIGVLALVFPPIGVLMIAIAVFQYWSIVRTARIKCPRCGNPFGTKSFIVLGHGANECESCGLSMSLLWEAEGKMGASHTQEWWQ